MGLGGRVLSLHCTVLVDEAYRVLGGRVVSLPCTVLVDEAYRVFWVTFSDRGSVLALYGLG